MNSKVLYTDEIDDLNDAAEDLFAQTEDFELKKNSMAIIFAEEDTDYPGLYNRLCAKWDFPIIGCTALGMLEGKVGYVDVGISVMLLTADDVQFAVGMTKELDTDNYREEIAATYEEIKKDIDDPKLIISFGGMAVTTKNVAGDALVRAIDKASGGVPIFGGTASDGFSFKEFRIYCNGRVSNNGQVMALISGNIEPRFLCINSIGNRANFSYEVTRSEKNRVYKLGNDTFLDALRKVDMDTDKSEVMGDYLLTPFIISFVQDDGDRVESARTLARLDHESGAGIFLGEVPEGTVINVGILSREEVQKSVQTAMEEMLAKITSTEHKYNTVLCMSCCARFLALASNIHAEADSFKGFIPEGMSLLGEYSYGEYCPARGIKTGKEYNMFHNFTFTILAL